MTQNELKAAMVAAMEAEVDGVLKAREGGKRLKLVEIEDVVLEARQRLGQRMAEGLIAVQESEGDKEAPMSEVSGKRLENKGKKTKRSRRG